MTKNEVKALIRKKMETAEKNYFESFAKKEFENCTLLSGYPSGISGGVACDRNVGQQSQ